MILQTYHYHCVESAAGEQGIANVQQHVYDSANYIAMPYYTYLEYQLNTHLSFRKQLTHIYTSSLQPLRTHPHASQGLSPSPLASPSLALKISTTPSPAEVLTSCPSLPTSTACGSPSSLGLYMFLRCPTNLKWTDVVQIQRIRKGGEVGHFSFLQKAGCGTVADGGLVITAWRRAVSTCIAGGRVGRECLQRPGMPCFC